MAELGEIAAGYAGRRVLLTGASGYVAHAIQRALAGVDCSIRRLARKELSRPEGMTASTEDHRYEQADAIAWDRLLDGVEVVFHCAAQTSVYAAMDDPMTNLAVNVGMPVALLDAARRLGQRPTVILASTATVYGLPETLPVTRASLPAPVTAYDVAKLAAEHYLALHARLGHVRGGSLRLANVYGPGPTSFSADRGVLNKMIRRALNGEPITRFGRGEWIRDYVYIDDVAEAFIRAGLAGDALGGKAALVCSGEAVTLAEALDMVVEAAAERTGKRVAISSVEPPSNLSPIEFRNFVGDWSPLAEAAGWRPRVGLRDGIGRTVAAFVGG